MNLELPQPWAPLLADELSAPYFVRLQAFLADQRRRHTVYPPAEDVFAALAMTPYDRVRVLLLGQDPYHGEGQAHGLCFSVRPGVAPPPSLVNILRELHDDLGSPLPCHGCLAACSYAEARYSSAEAKAVSPLSRAMPAAVRAVTAA